MIDVIIVGGNLPERRWEVIFRWQELTTLFSREECTRVPTLAAVNWFEDLNWGEIPTAEFIHH